MLTRVQATSPLWLVLLGASVYAGGAVAAMTIGSELIMGAVPPERAGAAAAVVETSSEFGGALNVASDLPARLSSELDAAARAACSHGLDTAALGAAVAMVVAAVFCARFFRGVRIVRADQHDHALPAARPDRVPQAQAIR